MNSKAWTRIIALTLLAALAIPVQLAAQETVKPHHPHQYHHYQLNVVGSFGGPSTYVFTVVPNAARLLNNRGTLVGSADTLAVDPGCSDYPDCYAAHASQWQSGVTTDLGVLPGGVGSQAEWVSANGPTAGLSDNGQPDPLQGGRPELHGVLWEHGGMTDLGTLPTGGYFSVASAVNDRGEVVGYAQNTIPDPNSMNTGYGYQTRAFYSKNGVMQDLGTLGTGTDAAAGLINERGQVVGWSYTNSSPTSGGNCPAFGFTLSTSSFIWDKRSGMKDLGGLGGTCTTAANLNNRGQVIGGSTLTGDSNTHPFVWDAATGMTDLLGASNGNYGYAGGENEQGDIVGGACNTQTCHALLWRKSGGKCRKTNLGTIAGFSFAGWINASEQVIGSAGTGPFLWEDGGPMVDLNTLLPPNSGIQLSEAIQINDRGEIAAQGPDANGNNHVVLLIPCDENHPGVEGCDYDLVDATRVAQTAASAYHPSTVPRASHSWSSNRYHIRGLRSAIK